LTILEAASQLRARKLSSVELTKAALDRVEKLNPRLNAFVTVLQQTALDRARKADEELARGADLGPLHGIPVAVKDVFCTKGVRTTCGSVLFTDHVPAYDAAVVEKLASSGAVLIGKLTLHELAYGVTSNNPHFGAVRNPWNPDCIPGGSSGGSGAAVASGMVFMATGSDTGGSIRIPAAFCGTVGLKPTFGRVSRYGVMPLDFTLDHMGPLTRSVRDAAVMLNAVAGYDARDDTSSRRPVEDYVPQAEPSIAGLRVGIPQNFYFERLHPDVDRAVRAMVQKAESLKAQIVPVRTPDIAALNAVSRVILMAEASALMEPHLGQRERFGSDVLALFDQGRLISATDYVNAQRLRRVMQREFHQVWSQVDCLFTPTAPIGAPRIGDATVTVGNEMEDVRLASTRLVRGMNLLGYPALSVPCGLDSQGMPIGLQIIGKPFSEALILRAAQALVPDEVPTPQL
jgi:aspartyl-tRNA(Asn)/glutamyl-tRNA(Gln) amidotransferase subunit A